MDESIVAARRLLPPRLLGDVFVFGIDGAGGLMPVKAGYSPAVSLPLGSKATVDTTRGAAALVHRANGKSLR